MTEHEAKTIIDKVIAQVFGYKNPFTLDEFLAKYAFDVRLPNKVHDTTTGEETWAQSTNPTKFIKRENSLKNGPSNTKDWMLPRRNIRGIEDILGAWNEINYISTERYRDTINVAQSDNIDNSENVFRSQDIHYSKNIIFCDGTQKCEFLVASQRSGASVYSIRVEDSINISESFGISWSAKISKSFMMHDCFDMSDSMFCSHLASKRFCIANMQFEEDEYFRIREQVIKWLLS